MTNLAAHDVESLDRGVRPLSGQPRPCSSLHVKGFGLPVAGHKTIIRA